jgi:hypothetical protein
LFFEQLKKERFFTKTGVRLGAVAVKKGRFFAIYGRGFDTGGEF